MSDYESWLVKKEEKAEQKNAVFWLIFCIIIIGIAMWCFVDISFLKNSDGKERVLQQSTMKDIMHISILKQEKAGLLFVRKVSSTKTRVIP